MSTPDLPGASDFIGGDRSFLAGLRPQDAVALPLVTVLDLLRERHGGAVDIALGPEAVDLGTPLQELPRQVRSPRAGEPDSAWLKTSNMVGVNVRTIGDRIAVLDEQVRELDEKIQAIVLYIPNLPSATRQASTSN